MTTPKPKSTAEQRRILKREGIATKRGLGFFVQADLGSAARKENRARRDLGRLDIDRVGPVNFAAQKAGFERRIEEARRTRANVREVQEAFRAVEAFDRGQRDTRSEDIERARVERTTEERERLLRIAREEQAQLARPLDPTSELVDSRILIDGQPAQTIGELEQAIVPSEAERAIGPMERPALEPDETAGGVEQTRFGELRPEGISQMDVDDAFGAAPLGQFDPDALAAFIAESRREEPDFGDEGPDVGRFTDEDALADFIRRANEPDAAFTSIADRLEPGALPVLIQTARNQQQSRERIDAARIRSVEAVRATNPSLASDLAAGRESNLAAAILAGAAPLDLAIQGFATDDVNQASDTAAAIRDIRPFITRPAGLGPVLGEFPQYDLAAGIAAGVPRQTWIDAGFEPDTIADALGAALARGATADELIDRGYRESNVIAARSNLVAPAATPRPVPPPGEEFPVPAALQQELRDSQLTAGAIAATSPAGLTPAALQPSAENLGVVKATIDAVKTGDLTPGEAQAVIDQVNEKGFTRQVTGRELASLVPIVGTTLAFQDAKRAGFTPLSTGFFVLSAGLDVVILAVPVARAGGAGLRFTAVRVAPALARAQAVSGRSVAALRPRLVALQGEAGAIADVGPGLRPRGVTAAPEAPPLRTSPEIRELDRIFKVGDDAQRVIDDQLRAEAVIAAGRRRAAGGGRPPPTDEPPSGGGGFNFEEEPLDIAIERFLRAQRMVKEEGILFSEAKQLIADEARIAQEAATATRLERARLTARFRAQGGEGGGETIPRSPRETPGTGGGAPDRPDPRLDPRADPVVLDDPLARPPIVFVDTEASKALAAARGAQIGAERQRIASINALSDHLRNIANLNRRLLDVRAGSAAEAALQQRIANETAQAKALIAEQTRAAQTRPAARPVARPVVSPATQPTARPSVRPTTSLLVAPQVVPAPDVVSQPGIGVAPQVGAVPQVVTASGIRTRPEISIAPEQAAQPAAAVTPEGAIQPEVAPAVSPATAPTGAVTPSVAVAPISAIEPTITPSPDLGTTPDIIVGLTPIVEPAITTPPEPGIDTPTGIVPDITAVPEVTVPPEITIVPDPTVPPTRGGIPRLTPRTPGPTGRTPPPPRPPAPRGGPPPGTPPPATPPPPDTPTPRGPTPRVGPGFRGPDGKTVAPPGFFAEIVQWPQGENMVQYNLFTGKAEWLDRKPDGTTAEKGFRVVKLTQRVPPKRVFSMGVFNVRTSKFGLKFEKASPGDAFKDERTRDNRFRSRGRP